MTTTPCTSTTTNPFRGDVAGGPHGDLTAYRDQHGRVVVLARIFDENDRAAAANRQRLDTAGVVAINLMSSPGAGRPPSRAHPRDAGG